ncbi:dormancy-associated protein homolog 4 isoform X1 [Herrania umbratica]|uniref:Dormancy-associated protein homolog 4 isoform X1 n=1 Tax=Herrania umbratica TaxID=108875 RepID=A0A6J1B4Y7_9ROSI|nr:dormancy-associated protein homolog 4 isoform X1 [Herrania umbratica]
MGFLHKLWDETLAGPMPETGLGKLRKYDSFSSTRSSPAPVVDGNNKMMITRSITILKSNSGFRNLSVEPSSTPDSPSGSSTPGTPFSPGTPRGDFRRFTRRKSSAEALESDESRSPTVYDWIVISALDR